VKSGRQVLDFGPRGVGGRMWLRSGGGGRGPTDAFSGDRHAAAGDEESASVLVASIGEATKSKHIMLPLLA
jgi:hypothetical protein